MKAEQELPPASQIADLVEQVVSTLDGMQARFLPLATQEDSAQDLTGCVSIGGAFQGAVTVRCPRRLAQRIASSMFAVPDAEVSEDAASDALGEFTHIVGGNIKSLLSQLAGNASCSLDSPDVATGTAKPPGAARRRSASFACGEMMFSVDLWELEDRPALGSAGGP